MKRKQREEVVQVMVGVTVLEIILCLVSFRSHTAALAIFALLMTASAAYRSWSTTVSDAQVNATPGSLLFRGRRNELRVDPGEIDSVLRVEPTVALLRTGAWTYRVRLLDRAPVSDLDALLAGIPVASGARAPSFTMLATSWQVLPEMLAATVLMVALVVAGLLFSSGSSSLLLIGQAMVPLALLKLLVPFLQATLTVGADGLLLRDRWSRRFISFARIRSVSSGATKTLSTISVELEDGTSRRLASAPHVATQLILAQIEAQRRRHAAAQQASDERLARAGRPLSTWRADLEQPVAFRSCAPTPDELQSVLASPTAPVDERIGAALALRRVPGDGEKRIRVAASTTANPVLRVALETIAEEELDEQRLETALRSARA